MYQLTSGTYSLEGVAYLSYGIRCGTTVIEDISQKKEEVETLVALCNSGDADPLHLPFLVEDYLCALDSAKWETALSYYCQGE